ncbi:hypothetical protein BS78_05G286200 [Paspalum vaginatum]|nr:hypothetical protein BS78_05G286200 [Paspalum vaginatum]
MAYCDSRTNQTGLRPTLARVPQGRAPVTRPLAACASPDLGRLRSTPPDPGRLRSAPPDPGRPSARPTLAIPRSPDPWPSLASPDLGRLARPSASPTPVAFCFDAVQRLSKDAQYTVNFLPKRKMYPSSHLTFG